MKFTVLTDRIATWDLRRITKYILVIALLVAVGTSYFWYTRVYMTPERRFWNAISNSMSTPSVVRTLTQGGSGNLVTQNYRFNYTPQRVIQNTVAFTERSATTDTQINTEGIITTSDQFLRYTYFSSNDGTNLDDLIGDWAVQSPEPGTEEQARLNYVSEMVTLAVFGNYDPAYRRSVLSELQNKNVYETDFSLAGRNIVDGEAIHSFNVTVKLPEYAAILGAAFVDAGFGEFPPLDPSGYREGSTINAVFQVRERDNTLVGITFGGREEKYSNYGVQSSVSIPQTDQTIQELQERVQAAVNTREQDQ